jgi:hypothetical protein
MDTFSLIVVSDETSPVRRFEIRKDLVKRAMWGGGVALVLLLGLFVDYVLVRVDNRELAGLRQETLERREQVAGFQDKLQVVDSELSKLQEFERKVRIIANLPGSAGAGGEDVTAVGSDPVRPPQGGGGIETATPGVAPEAQQPARIPLPPENAGEAERVSLLEEAAVYLGEVAEGQNNTLAELIEALEGKRDRLASSPSVWPTKGWLTSRYGNRISPFTNKAQFHAGIDIAGRRGTDVIAPARGKVVFSGKRGAT